MKPYEALDMYELECSNCKIVQVIYMLSQVRQLEYIKTGLLITYLPSRLPMT